MPSRRSLLAGSAGVAVIAIGGGALFAFTRTPEAAREPWHAPGAGVDDPRVRALEWAVLAPSPHNMQQWLVELVGEDEALLHCDLDRRLPQTDPFDRQTLVGLGGFMELFELAAGADGRAVTTTLFPDGAPPPDGRLDERPVARLVLAEGDGRRDPLFSAAPIRRTSREPFEERAVTPAVLERLSAAAGSVPVGATTEPDEVAALRSICRRAWEVEVTTPRVYQESVDVMRIGKAEINADPDGIAIGGALPEALALAGLVTRETLADPDSTAFRSTVDMYAGAIDTARGFVWQASAGNTREEQVAAGRDWLRMCLAAAGEDLSIHPLSQALQEFAEMEPLFAEVHAALGVEAPGRVQMLARVGYGPDVPPSPRWPARSRIIA
jgi:hypothetical protein